MVRRVVSNDTSLSENANRIESGQALLKKRAMSDGTSPDKHSEGKFGCTFCFDVESITRPSSTAWTQATTRSASGDSRVGGPRRCGDGKR